MITSVLFLSGTLRKCIGFSTAGLYIDVHHIKIKAMGLQRMFQFRQMRLNESAHLSRFRHDVGADMSAFYDKFNIELP